MDCSSALTRSARRAMQILIHMTYLRLGGCLRAHFNKKHKRKNFKRYAWPFTRAE
jgi:hypothetical protein